MGSHADDDRGLTLPDVATELHPGLWMSGMPQPDWPLQRWGVRLVVSLSEHLPPHAAARYEWGTRGGAHGDGDVMYLHWPFVDGDAPEYPLAELAASTVAAAVQRRLVVLVHCQEGRNRSGLISALAVRTLTGCSGADAVTAVRTARPPALANRAFRDAITSLDPV